MSVTISASILAADFGNLQKEIERTERAGCDMIHFDVMDGLFVPNISFGIPVLSSIKKYSTIPFDVHLMINKPYNYIKDFATSGADIITIHEECLSPIEETLDLIHSLGLKAGISIRPNTPVENIKKYLHKVEMILIMTVEPGFGGQAFIESSIDKIKETKKIISEINPDIKIEVDGGINEKTAQACVKAGAEILVAGSYLFKHKDISEAVNNLRAL